jgi:DNA polymerase I
VNQAREVYLIDGSSYIYRAFYAMRNLSTSAGLPTNAIFICARMLITLLKEKNPEHVCFVLDARGPTFRHELYEDYKATRQRMPEDLSVQIPYILQVVDALGIPMTSREGHEADDIIAALATRCGDGCRVFVVSGDKDLMQLVNDRVVVWDTLSGKVYDRTAVFEKFGVYPEFIPDLLAIMGDSSDNVPGVPGIGAKGAAALVQAHGHVHDIIEQADSIRTPKLMNAIKEHTGELLDSLALVRLDSGMELDFGVDDLVRKEPDKARLVQLFTELEFKGLLGELGIEKPDSGMPAHEGRIELSCRSDFTGDVGLYFMPGAGSAVAQGGVAHVCLEEGRGLEPMKSAGAHLVMHDAKQAFVEAIQNGAGAGAEVDDVMLGAYCIDAANGTVSLEDLAKAHMGRDIPRDKDLLGSGRGAKAVSEIDRDTLAGYLASHAEVLLPLRDRLSELMREAGVDRVYQDIEIPLTKVLAHMEACGVLVDTDGLKGISREISGFLQGMEGRIYGLAGQEFNINSPKQLGEILFEKLGLPAAKKTKTGYSTDSKVLESLSFRHDLPQVILEYRMYTKLKNTYVDALPEMMDPRTGRIHTRFNQAVTATGRISSSEPNLQNIPVRSEMGKRIREAFTAPPGHLIVSADYSQIELRILAHITGDPSLRQAFAEGVDIHAKTASEIFGTPLDKVVEAQRRVAKTINFGIMYGMGPHKLSQELRIKRDTAKQYIDSYLSRYASIREYMDAVSLKAEQDGFVTTLLGRRRSIPEIGSSNFNEREAGRRIAINTPIQGTAADIIKIAMVRIFKQLEGFRSRMILQVHDELVFEAATEEVDALSEMVRREMETAMALDVPVQVDIGAGKNWAEAH